MPETFEAALAERVATMVDACTRCGKCVEVCPVTGPGGVKAEPRKVISGILDIPAHGRGTGSFTQMGECLRAFRRVHHGV